MKKTKYWMLVICMLTTLGLKAQSDVTHYIVNPSFNTYNTEGWIVDMPGAQNKGFQNNNYKNGSSYIDMFAEAWIPAGGYLGKGSILQSIDNLPNGKYTIEVDAIATDQSNMYYTVTGVNLVAESDLEYQQALSTGNGAPQHFTLTFFKTGNPLVIGLRTNTNATANWIAFDNVKLYYEGKIPSTTQTTGISVSRSKTGSLYVGEEEQLTANITTTDDLYNHAIWSSSDESVATVNTKGVVTAHHTGTVTITAKAVGTNLTSSVNLTIIKEDVSGLLINEIQVANIDQFVDPSYNYGGWIELYNPTGRRMQLGMLYVSDDKSNLTKFQLPNNMGYIQAGGFRPISFDHNAADGNYGGNAEQNVNFKLKTEGGTIYLSDADGQLVTSVTYPACVPRCSYARTTDGGTTWGTTGEPSPSASNENSTFATERLAAPIVSRDGGVFTNGTNISFSVEIPEGATLRYTTDGSTPATDNGDISSNGQFITSTTKVYRFALFKDGFLPSPVVTRSFIFKNHNYYLPVLSIVTNPENLFDETIGIYTKGSNGTSGNGQSGNCNWNRDWERPVNIEYMVPDKNDASSFITELNQESDMEIAGGWSRAFQGSWGDNRYWEMRGSFRLKADKRFEGANSFDYPVFPNKPYNKYKVWQVRNGGNDDHRTKDACIGQAVLQSGFYVDAQDASPTHIFFNGEYLGMFNIRESNNRHYGDSNYGIDTDDMDQFDLSNAQYNQKVGDNQAWNELLELSRQLIETGSVSVWNEICKRMDMDEYINYMALECYFGSSDWLTNVNNFKGFRSRTDGKFHFVLFDTDAAFDYNNMLSRLITSNYGSDVDDLFRNLWYYDPFKKQFIDAYCIVNGSVMHPDFVYSVTQNFYNRINTAMQYEQRSSSMEVADRNDGFHNGNPMTVLQTYTGAEGPYQLNLSSNVTAARLSLNGQLIPTGKFEGYAYNYYGNGINLTAKAPAGYRFRGWKQLGYSASGTSNTTTIFDQASTWMYYDQGSMDYYSWKAKSFSATNYGWKEASAPFGYAASGKFMQENANTILNYGSNSSSKRPTYYFRKSISLSNTPADGESYILHYQVDDGCRIHINGTDVGGYHCDKGATYSTYSTTYEGDAPYEGELDITNYLVAGSNVIAIDVHNTSATSSDIYFEAWLTKNTLPEGDDIISTNETFCLTDKEGIGTYTLTAVYDAIEGEVKRNEDGATPIRINEVSAGNDIYVNEYTKKNDWVELYNTTNAPVDVAGMYLSDNDRKPQKWQISKTSANGTEINTVVPANGRLIVWCDDLAPISQLHSGFKLSNADGACVSIQAEDGRWADHMQYLEQPRWYTYGRYPDGGNHEQLLSQPTIGKPNRIGLFDYTSISEENFLSDDITITLAMAEGWNWTSHNMMEAVDKSRFTSYAGIIRGNNAELFNDDVLGWQGLLKTLDPAVGYKIKMNAGVDITLRGDLFPSTQTVNVNKGWNWIGCPLPNATTLTVALANYKATEGDMLVSQNALATYTSGTWKGTLTTLQPGQAYMLMAGSSQSFVWKALSGNKVNQRRYVTARQEDVTPWALNIHAYPNVMPMMARIEAEGIDLSAGYTLGVFEGDECRGVAKLEDDILYINVHGEGGEQMSFRLLDAEGDTYLSSQLISMQSLQALGSVQNPYRIRFNAKDITPVIAPQGTSDVMATVYYSLNGQRLTQPKGICIQKTYYMDGTMKVKKIVR